MRHMLGRCNKQCYLAPYLKSKHWQLLVLCPSSNVVVLFCSLGRRATKELKAIVETSIDARRMLDGNRPRPTKWIFPNATWLMGVWILCYEVDARHCIRRYY